MKKLILVTNDDGYRSEGIVALSRELQSLGDVYVAAPEEEKSAVSHAITLRDPVRIRKISGNVFAVRGTPADCVILAVKKILPRKPDLVLSGINYGRNLGDDMMYSGTVAGAREACYLDIPSIAVSSAIQGGIPSWMRAARFSRNLAGLVMKNGLPRGTFLNVNVPSTGKIKGVRMSHQGSRLSRASLLEGSDPRGNPFFWIGEEPYADDYQEEAGSDYEAIRQGYISITPLQRDQTSYPFFELWGDGVRTPSIFLPGKKKKEDRS